MATKTSIKLFRFVAHQASASVGSFWVETTLEASGFYTDNKDADEGPAHDSRGNTGTLVSEPFDMTNLEHREAMHAAYAGDDKIESKREFYHWLRGIGMDAADARQLSNETD